MWEEILNNNSIAGILVSALFVAVFVLFRFNNAGLLKIAVLLSGGIAIFLLTESRSGLIGILGGVAINYTLTNKLRRKQIAVIFISVLSVLFFLLFYKQGSTEGRTHIYRISYDLLKDNWQTGVGIGKFKATFNEYQADYFMQNDINSNRALMADNTFYAFNDYLQWFAETGIAGLLLMCAAIIILLKRINAVYIRNKENRLLAAAIAGLSVLAIASLFSYPLQVLPVQLLCLLFIGIIFFFPDGKIQMLRGYRFSLLLARMVLIGLTCLTVFKGVKTVHRIRKENSAFYLALGGNTTEARKAYSELINYWPVNEHNQVLYAEQLYMAGRLNEAISNLDNAQSYYVDNRVYLLRARIEKELGNYEKAKGNYLRAIYMVPNRMSSRFELLQFFVVRKDTLNAVKWANSIIGMPVKVPSERTRLMLRDVNVLRKQLVTLNASSFQ